MIPNGIQKNLGKMDTGSIVYNYLDHLKLLCSENWDVA